MRTHHSALTMLLLGALALIACDAETDDDDTMDARVETDGGGGVGGEAGMGGVGGEGGAPVAVIDIVGDYIDDYDIPHAITADGWTQGMGDTLSTTTLTDVDNTASRAIGQNTADHPFAADAWSRYDWTFADGRLWYCQPVFDAADAAAAAAGAASDPADPATSGCGAFPWSGLTPAIAPGIAGRYMDAFDTAHEVSGSRWSVGEGDDASHYIFTQVGDGWAIAFNDAGNGFNPGLWSRFDWAVVDEVLYQCQSAYDAPSAAVAGMASADATAPAEGGCGMFPWSALQPVE